YLFHHAATREHVRDAAGDAQIVLQHYEVPVGITDQVSTNHRYVYVAGNFDVAHFTAVMFAGIDDAAGHDTVLNNFALVVDIFEEKIQRRDALCETALDFFPFRRRDNPGQQIVRKNPLSSFITSVHGESDSLVKKGLVSLVL